MKSIYSIDSDGYITEIKDVLESVLVFNGKKLITLTNKQCRLSYRNSIFKKRFNFVIVSATFKLKQGNAEEIKASSQKIIDLRVKNHPLNYPSAGSVFKRHKKLITSKTIDELGLKGYTVGGAQISVKHAGFIINAGNATFEDVLSVIGHIKKEVYKQKKAKLKLEVRILGD